MDGLTTLQKVYADRLINTIYMRHTDSDYHEIIAYLKGKLVESGLDANEVDEMIAMLESED